MLLIYLVPETSFSGRRLLSIMTTAKERNPKIAHFITSYKGK